MQDLGTTLAAIAANPTFRTACWAVILVIITRIVERVATRAVSHLLHHDSNPLPSSSIIINIVRGVIWVVGACVILDSCFGQNTSSSIITALGVGGIAVSLGFQDTLANLIGGLQVTFMGIVKPGDNIEVSGSSGVVQDVTWRHTTIRDAAGQTVIVPNSIISKNALVHLLPASRVTVPFAIPRYLTVVDEDGTRREGAGEPVDIDDLTERVITHAREAAGAVSPVTDGPKVFFSEVSELGIKGKVILTIEDAGKTGLAADAVVRALARELG